MNLKLQVGLTLGLILVVWLAYAALLQTTLGWGLGAFAGFFCAIILLVLVAIVLAFLRQRRAARLVAASRLAWPRESGYAMFEGRLEPVVESVASPMSGKPCVAWEYEFETSALDEAGKVDPRRNFEWFGIGQVALQIVMPYGNIPIRAGAMFETQNKQRVKRAEGAEGAERLRSLPTLQVVEGASSFGSMLTHLDGLFGDEDGDVRLDYVKGPWESSVRTGKPKMMYEKRGEAGDNVVVAGVFDTSQRAIVRSRHGVLIASGKPGTSDGSITSPAEYGLMLFILGLNIVTHALVVFVLVRPPDF